MKSSQQQQNQSLVKKQTTNTIAKSQADTLSSSLCPKCNAEVNEDAFYCPECGDPLKQRICPKCGAANTISADICQSCNTWLLEGQCKFCYAKLGEEASFCPECGKPQAGIPCPNCGNLSTFDFCSKCGTPVTEEAVAEVQAAKAEAPALAASNAQTTAMEAELAELETLINSELEIEDYNDVIEEEPVRKSLFSERQITSIIQTGRDIDETNRKRAEEKRQAEEAERQRQIREAQAKREELQRKQAQAMAAQKAAAIERAKQDANKRFSSNQQARNYYNARRHPDAIGWMCNYAGCVHLYPDGSNGCHCPEMGGRDVFGTFNDLK